MSSAPAKRPSLTGFKTKSRLTSRKHAPSLLWVALQVRPVAVAVSHNHLQSLEIVPPGYPASAGDLCWLSGAGALALRGVESNV
jgi:hypothetical protein